MMGSSEVFMSVDAAIRFGPADAVHGNRHHVLHR
jgi:hypothetical protein